MDQPALDYCVGMTDTNHWRLVGPAHKQRFLEYDKFDTDNDGDGVTASVMLTHKQ